MPLDRKKVFYSLLALFLLIPLAVFFYWFFYSRFYETTDDAYVNGNQIVVNPQISGTVIKIGADNSFFVEKGHLLVTIDPADYDIELNQAQEKLALACREVVDLFENVKEKNADLLAKKATLLNASQDFERRKALLPAGAISLEDYQKATANLAESSALYELSQAQLEAAMAQVAGTTVLTHPKVVNAIEALKNAYLQRQRCSIMAPASGIIAQRNAQIGGWVSPSSNLMTIIPISQMWVDANFRERQLKKMKIGQKVQLESDIYGGSVEYMGKIAGIGGGTGSVFSLLPPQNATGNWVKIVQRVPVRIELDPEQLKKYPLRLGLSMTATVNLKDQEGATIPKPLSDETIYQTDIYELQDMGVMPLIQAILKKNIPPSYL